MKTKQYYVYITTNLNRSVLYTGFTGDLENRIQEHYEGLMSGFSRRYNCKYLVYYESFPDVLISTRIFNKYAHHFSPVQCLD